MLFLCILNDGEMQANDQMRKTVQNSLRPVWNSNRNWLKVDLKTNPSPERKKDIHPEYIHERKHH